MPPACARRVAGMLRGLREPSLQDRTGEGGEPGLGILASCPVRCCGCQLALGTWKGGRPPSSWQEAGETGVATSESS